MIKKERLLKTFFDLVQIDSPSGFEKEFAKYVAKLLKQLGAEVEFDTYGNVIGKIDGIGEPMMLNAHLDTVEPGRGIKPIIKGDKITSDGTTILGGDSKAGIAAILETLQSLKEDKSKHLPIEIVFTLGEEIGLKGAVNLDYKKISAKHGITFDGVYAVNNITTSAPGYTRVDATIIGKGYHASQPQKGISSIQIASEIIQNLKIGKIDNDTTANIGLIEGGTARNAVPEKTQIKAEIRSLNLEKLEKHSLHFQKVFNKISKKYPEAKILQELQTEFNPYAFDEEHHMIKIAKQVLKELGLKAILEISLGATDVNIFHTHGIEVVCVGAGYYEAHTTREYVVISELLQAAMFCERLVSS